MSRLRLLFALIATMLALAGCADLGHITMTQRSPFNDMTGQ